MYEHLNTYEDYREALAEIISGSVSGEKPPPAFVQNSPVSERLVQNIWFDGHLKKDALETVSGKVVEIIHPGRWNRPRSIKRPWWRRRRGPRLPRTPIRLYLPPT